MGNNNSSYRNRSNSTSISDVYSGTDEDTQILNSYQKAVLRAAWRHMSCKKSHSSCGRTILKRLNFKDSSIKTIFQHFSVLGNVFNNNTPVPKPQCGYDKHAEILVEFLDFVMTNLDDPNVIAQCCEEIGRVHRKVKIFGMKTDHLDLVGESIIETVREYQGWRRHRQAIGATNIVISFVIDRIRSGFLQRLEIPASVKTPQTSIDQDSDFAASIRRYSSRRKAYNRSKSQEPSTRWKRAITDVVNNNAITTNNHVRKNEPVYRVLPASQEIKIQHLDNRRDEDV